MHFLARLPGVNAWVVDDGVIYDSYTIHRQSALVPFAPERPYGDADAATCEEHVVGMEFIKRSGDVVAAEADRVVSRPNYFQERSIAMNEGCAAIRLCVNSAALMSKFTVLSGSPSYRNTCARSAGHCFP